MKEFANELGIVLPAISVSWGCSIAGETVCVCDVVPAWYFCMFALTMRSVYF